MRKFTNAAPYDDCVLHMRLLKKESEIFHISLTRFYGKSSKTQVKETTFSLAGEMLEWSVYCVFNEHRRKSSLCTFSISSTILCSN